MTFNAPKNFTRDIDLPAIIPRLLIKFFNARTFYSSSCRIPNSLFRLAKQNNDYGFYFLKGAYLDEGSISGGQLWIVRSIKNKPLARDIVKLCGILDIKCRLKLSSKKLNGYSVGVKKESFDVFFNNIQRLFWNKNNNKLLKLEQFIIRHRTPRKRDSFGRYTRREVNVR